MGDFSSLVVLILLIIVGFTFRKIQLLKDEHIKAIPSLVFTIAYPAMILLSVTNVDLKQQSYESMIVVLSTLIITILIYVISILSLIKYKNYNRKSLLIFNLGIGNITFVMLPIIQVIFGDIGVYYAILHGASQDILIWTLYYGYFKSDGGRNKIKLVNMISPCFIALVIALTFQILNVKFYCVVEEALITLSGLTTPLALLYIGGAIGGSKHFKIWQLDIEIIITSIFKIIIMPFIIYTLMLIIPIDEYLRILIAFVFSAPTTLMSTVWAKEFNMDYEFSIKFLFFSTCLFFMSVVPFFYLVKL